jgi:protein O-GlcNAc transferase
LADSHFSRDQLRQAILAYSQVVRLDPSEGVAWLRIANAQERLGMIDDAVESYAQAVSLRPNDINAQFMAATAMPRIIASEAQILKYRGEMENKLAAIVAEYSKCDLDNYEQVRGPFYIAYHNKNDRYLNSLLASAYSSVIPDLDWRAPHCISPSDRGWPRRIKLGIASDCLSDDHTIGKLNLGFIERICREKFEVIIIRQALSHAKRCTRVDAAADRVVIVPHDLTIARQSVADLNLDVLHYPDVGMSNFFYLLAFARLAPIQTVSWGHPETTGIPNMDYFISSRCLEASDADQHYSEKLVLLDGPPNCYRRPLPPEEAADRGDYGLPELGALYACPHTLFRLHPEYDEVLGTLLRRDSDAHLVFISDEFPCFLTKPLRQRFSRSIPDVVDRIIFLPHMSSEKWLNFLRLVDCVLDPRSFSGGNTSYEALAMGTPVVTWANSPFLRGRITLALYLTLGLSDCIAYSREEYVGIAQRLAHDRAWRHKVVQLIEERSFLIFEQGGMKMVRSLEQFLENTVRKLT